MNKKPLEFCTGYSGLFSFEVYGFGIGSTYLNDSLIRKNTAIGGVGYKEIFEMTLHAGDVIKFLDVETVRISHSQNTGRLQSWTLTGSDTPSPKEIDKMKFVMETMGFDSEESVKAFLTGE